MSSALQATQPQPNLPSNDLTHDHDSSSFRLPILIAGAGLVGLALSHALTAQQIPHIIFDRDHSSTSSPGGWGITLHWALPELQSLISPALYSQLHTCQVDPAHSGSHDDRKFQYLDLNTAKVLFDIPPTAQRERLNRKKFRDLLATGVDVRWGHSISSFATDAARDTVTVCFDDGLPPVTGSLLVGADGANSRIRRQLLGPDEGALTSVAVRLLGATVRLTPEQATPLLAINPLLFQGGCRDTGRFLWFSVLSTPATNGSLDSHNHYHSHGNSEANVDGKGYYEVQVVVSWMVSDDDNNDNNNNDDDDGKTNNNNNDKNNKKNPPDSPPDNLSRLHLLQSLTQTFHPTFRALTAHILPTTPIQAMTLSDYQPSLAPWPSHAGLVTLVGDAAHAMTMYRGEGLGHGLVDCVELVDCLRELYPAPRRSETDRGTSPLCSSSAASSFGRKADEVSGGEVTATTAAAAARTPGGGGGGGEEVDEYEHEHKHERIQEQEQEQKQEQAWARSRASAISRYETGMKPRAHRAVGRSRTACVQAHDVSKLTADSEVIRGRSRDE